MLSAAGASVPLQVQREILASLRFSSFSRRRISRSAASCGDPPLSPPPLFFPLYGSSSLFACAARRVAARVRLLRRSSVAAGRFPTRDIHRSRCDSAARCSRAETAASIEAAPSRSACRRARPLAPSRAVAVPRRSFAARSPSIAARAPRRFARRLPRAPVSETLAFFLLPRRRASRRRDMGRWRRLRAAAPALCRCCRAATARRCVTDGADRRQPAASIRDRVTLLHFARQPARVDA